MPELNKWITKSIEIAEAEGYLDSLLGIYPLTTNKERTLVEGTEEKIKELIEAGNKRALIDYLLELEKFPIATAYNASLRYTDIMDRNPKTVEEMGKILLNMGSEKVIKGAKEPKIVSKQAGSMFARWVASLYPLLPSTRFESATEPSLLKGSDKSRKKYANERLDAGIEEKGIDLLLKKGDKFVMGQAKFITAGGGGQDNQFFEALRFVNSARGSAERIALIDGIIWFDDKFLTRIKKSNKNIMSALLLKSFVDEL